MELPNFNETENLTVIENYDVENRNKTDTGHAMDYFYIDFPKIGYEIFKNKMAQAMEMYESFMTKNPVILKVNRSNLSSNGTINLTILNNNITEEVNTSLSDMQRKPETNTESPFKLNTTEIYENSVQNFSESNIVTQNHTNYNSPSVLETSTENQSTIYEANNTAIFEDNKSGTNEANKTISDGGNKTVSNDVNQTSSNEANKTTIDETKKTKVAPVGFFGQVSNTVTNIFHSLTNWF